MNHCHSILCEVLKHTTVTVEVSTSFLFPPHTHKSFLTSPSVGGKLTWGDQVFPQTICSLLFCPLLSQLNDTWFCRLLFHCVHSSPGLGIPIPPCGFSLSVSNPTSLTLGHLLRLSSAPCPEVMSHFDDGGLHVKGTMCNFGFHRRVISPLPPHQFPASRLGAQPSEVSFPPPPAP